MTTWTDPYQRESWRGNESIRDELRSNYSPSLDADVRDWHERRSLKLQIEHQELQLKHLRDQNRELTEALEALTRGTGGIVPNYQRQGDFTVCVLGDPIAERIFTGVAKCSPTDKFDDTIGQAISFGRAAAVRAEYYAKAAFAR